MFYSGKIIKLLLRENARLRAEVRRRDARFDEFVDKFVHNRIPERFQDQNRATQSLSQSVTSLPSDAYSAAIEDAEKLVDEKYYKNDFTSEEEYDSI